MSTQENVQIVKNFFAAMGRGDRRGLLALSAEDIEWIIPGEDWPLAGTHRGHAELADVLQKASEAAGPDPSTLIPHETIRKVDEYCEPRQRLAEAPNGRNHCAKDLMLAGVKSYRGLSSRTDWRGSRLFTRTPPGARQPKSTHLRASLMQAADNKSCEPTRSHRSA